jgi:primosomal protein N' (replication factor Y)
VYINQLNIQLDRPFDYIIPKELEDGICPGMRVMVPFGHNNKPIDALVTQVDESESSNELKSILALVMHFPVLDDKQLALCRFVQEHYHTQLMDVANAYFPGSIKIQKHKHGKGTTTYYVGQRDRDVWMVSLTEKAARLPLEQLLELVKLNATRQRNVLSVLHQGPLDEKQLNQLVPGSKNAVNVLMLADLVVRMKRSYKKPMPPPTWSPQLPLILTEPQQKILEAFRSDPRSTHLIHGVTGSGKTELYLRMMDDALQQGKTCLYLVPEISLTPQTINRVKERFGEEIAVIHSKVGDLERAEQYEKIASKALRIIVGARSAIFSPFQDLGLIIMDEEHETTYKSSNRPRFDTLPLAQETARLHGAKVVLGSATPSVGSYYLANEGGYAIHRLPDRMNGQNMPRSTVVDMRSELQAGNRSFLSRTLYAKMKETLGRKEQMILFLNKRGYFSYVFCRDCGFVVKCDKCDVTMTYHSDVNRLECHYCKSTTPVRKHCPACNSEKLKYSGSGTERMEAQLRKYFPDATVLRMDTDAMRKKNALTETLEEFASGKGDILLGTQMVTKGFDFENVTLVGVLLADLTLNFPDFRASERTFQLITQVAGRSGRGSKEGQVVIQTYEPEHYVIQHAKNHDYEGFYEKELAYRDMNRYPPFSALIYVGFSGNVEEDVAKDCQIYHRILVEKITALEPSTAMDVYPPSKSNIVRVNNRYRYYILIKTDQEPQFREALHQVQQDSGTKKLKSTIFVDVNPNFIF